MFNSSSFADSQLQVTKVDTGLLVVTGSVTGQHQQPVILRDGDQVDGRTDALGVRPLAEHTMGTTDEELELIRLC